MPDRLAASTSPSLRQHADNPVLVVPLVSCDGARVRRIGTQS
jgi:hypothetical protein